MVEVPKSQTLAARKVKGRRKPPSPNSILDRRALTETLDELDISTFHIPGFYSALHRQHYPDLPTFVENYYKYDKGAANATSTPLKNPISATKNFNNCQLPKKLLEYLATTKDFVTITSEVALKQISSDNSTTKLAIRLHDGQLVESVIMRYQNGKGSGRASLCVSSQCGCAMGCTFCATGTMGLSGNLTSAEILEQMVHANRILAEEWEEKENNGATNIELVRNVVFMGMGEPLDNYRNVVDACQAMIDRKRWNLAHGRVTVSTVGLVSQIRKLTAELPEVSLALSLHAPNQEARTEIVPTAARYPIEDLIDALDNHMMAYSHKRNRSQDYTHQERIRESKRRRAMIEYVMLEGPTSTLECAHQLGKLCEGRHLVVNLIPYNSTDVADKLHCPPRAHMEEFRGIVASYGAFCTIRKTMGADIDSACGQLITLQKEKKSEASVRDIEDGGCSGGGNGCSSSLSPTGVIPSSLDEKERTAKSEIMDETIDDDVVDWSCWVNPLAIGTVIAGTCFVVSTTLLLRQSRRR